MAEGVIRVKKTTRAKRHARTETSGPKNGSEVASPSWLSRETESQFLLQLRSVVGMWANHFHNLPPGAARTRALAASRALKAVLDCYAADDQAALEELGKHAKRTLQDVAAGFFARSQSFMVDLTDRDARGWWHSLGDVYSEKGDRDWHGRASHIRMRVNALEWQSERGTLTPDAFASSMEHFLTGAFVDVSDLLAEPLREGAELEDARVRARREFQKWERCQNSDDFGALFRAGLRAFGVDKTKADNLFAAEEQRSRRAAAKRRKRSAATPSE